MGHTCLRISDSDLGTMWHWDFLPVVKYLTSHDMSSDPPHVPVTFVAEPIVTYDLHIEVVCFKRGMVDMEFSALEKEERMVIHQLFAPL